MENIRKFNHVGSHGRPRGSIYDDGESEKDSDQQSHQTIIYVESMLRNSNKSKGRGGGWAEFADDGSGFIRSVTGVGNNEKANDRPSIIESDDGFPRSPTEAEPTSSNDAPPPADSTPSTVASTDDYYRSRSADTKSDRGDDTAKAAAVDTPISIIPYEGHELMERFDDDYAALSIIDSSSVEKKRSAHLAPVMEGCAACETNPPRDEGKRKGWVGIGLGGETIALSVMSGGSESPESVIVSRGAGREEDVQQENIPAAIDFERFEPHNLPKVKKKTTMVDINGAFPLVNAAHGNNNNNNKGTHLLRRSKRSVARKVLHDVEELSVDLSVIEEDGGVESIASVMTKDDCVDLAKRLQGMERQLLDLAGETPKEDAMRALARAVHRQSQLAKSLQRKLRSREEKIGTLEDLCGRLLDRRKRRDDDEEEVLRSSSSAREIREARDANAQLTLELRRSEMRVEELEARLAGMMSDGHRGVEEECARRSRPLWQSYNSEGGHDNAVVVADNNTTNNSHNSRDKYNSTNDEENDRSQVGYEELKQQSCERVAEDAGATVRKLEKEMASMAEAHAKKERRSKNKIWILMEIKSAMEEQIRLLEEKGKDEKADDDASV